MDARKLRRAAYSSAAWICLCAGVIVACWQLTNHFADRRIDAVMQHQVHEVERSAEAISRLVERRLSFLRGVAALLAEDDVVQHLVAALNRAGSDAQSQVRANDRLVEFTKELGLSTALIIDAGGTVAAASNASKPSSMVGKRIIDRNDYAKALLGERSEQYSAGGGTNVPGLLFAAPVKVSGAAAGAVILQLDLPSVAYWVDGADAFISDRHGVIILASNRERELRHLESGTISSLSPEARLDRYGRSEFKPLAVTSMFDKRRPRLVSLDNSEVPHLIARVPVGDSELTVHVTSRLDEIRVIEVDAKWAFALLSLCLLAISAFLIGAFLYARKAVAHRKSLAKVNEDLQQLNLKLDQEATTDALTGCTNRRRFMQFIETEFSRAVRHGEQFSVMVADIDHFKVVNDTHGHAVGDVALQHFAAVGKKLARREDVFARMGGEEFVFLLPETDEAGALVLAERLRRALAEAPAAIPAGQLSMTVSIGVAAFDGTIRRADELLERADRALYVAKRTGRNRVAGHQTLSLVA